MIEHFPEFETASDGELPVHTELTDADIARCGLNPEFVEWRTLDGATAIYVPAETFLRFAAAENYTSPGARVWNLLEQASRPDHVDGAFFAEQVIRDEEGALLGVKPDSLGLIISYVKEYHVPGFGKTTVGRLDQVRQWVQMPSEPAGPPAVS